MCWLPQNQLLWQQAAVVAKQPAQISIHISSVIRIERGLEGEPEHRNPCISIYICLLPDNLPLYQQAVVVAEQLGHLSIHTSSLIKIEMGLVGEP